MAKASIHIEPIKSSSEIHNKRLKEFDYIRKDLSEKNEMWEERSISEVRREVEEKYLRNVGQKMQKKATPIREGVVLLKPEHTMADLFRLKEKLYEELGIKTFQIYIHRDEGHWKNTDSEELKQYWNPNLHAHMVFDWTDEKGKSLRLNIKQMSQIQDIVAETLEMERGQRANVTGRKHLNPLEYKLKVMWEDVKGMKKKKEELEYQLRKLEEDTEGTKDVLQMWSSRYKEKYAEFQRFFQSDINVSLFKKSVSNGFFGRKKEVLDEEEIEKLIQSFSFSTENWKEEKKLREQYENEKWEFKNKYEILKKRWEKPDEKYLRYNLSIIEKAKQEEREKEEARRIKEAERDEEKKREVSMRLMYSKSLPKFMKEAIKNALEDYGNRIERANIDREFQKILEEKNIPDMWISYDKDKVINEELEKYGINLQQQRKRGLRR